MNSTTKLKKIFIRCLVATGIFIVIGLTLESAGYREIAAIFGPITGIPLLGALGFLLIFIGRGINEKE